MKRENQKLHPVDVHSLGSNTDSMTDIIQGNDDLAAMVMPHRHIIAELVVWEVCISISGVWYDASESKVHSGRWMIQNHPECWLEIASSKSADDGLLVREFSIVSGTEREHQVLRLETLRVRAYFEKSKDPDSNLVVSVPMARFIPRRRWDEVVARPAEIPVDKSDIEFQDLGVAPDCGLGHVVIANPALPKTLQIIPLPEKSSVSTAVFGVNGMLCVEHTFDTPLLIEAGSHHTLGRWLLKNDELGLDESLKSAGALISEMGVYAPPATRPAWAGVAAILEVDIVHFGGLGGVIQQLPEIKSQGFDAVYLMPWHVGKWSGYGTVDYHQMEPEKGQMQDLRRLTDAAHGQGTKVLFDLLVNFTIEESPYVKDHPDWFYPGEDGLPARHQTWPGYCLDPASPGFRRFLLDYCDWCVRECGCDGFRVDAVAYRGGNWSPLPGLQPRDHAHAIFTLLAEIRESIRRTNPEAILMAECFGPAQLPVSDLVCFQWIGWLDWCLSRVAEGKLTGRNIQHLIADHFSSMPTGTWLTTYTHTHDTVAFEGREIDGPAVTALFHTLGLLSAGVMVFGGGWEMRVRPSEEEKPEYSKLFCLRHWLGPLSCHDLVFDEQDRLDCLFHAHRQSLMGPVEVVTNFSAQTIPMPSSTGAIIGSRCGSVKSILPWDTVVISSG